MENRQTQYLPQLSPIWQGAGTLPDSLWQAMDSDPRPRRLPLRIGPRAAQR